MTWSIESAIVRAYSTAAVGVQAVLDTFATAERITRPPRRPFADVDEPLAEGLDYTRDLCPANCDCGECYRNPERNCHCFDGADQLAEREAEEEVSEPHCGAAKPGMSFAVCTRPPGHDGDHGYAGIFWPKFGSCPKCCAPYVIGRPCTTCLLGSLPGADTPNPTEPGLSDDELVGVRGLLQERYEDDRRPKWLRDIEVGSREQAAAILRGDPPPCDHRYCARQGYAMCFGVTGAQMDMIEDARASAPVIHTGAGAEPNSPAASAAGDSGGAVCGHSPESPASPRSDPDDAGAEWVGWAVPAISEVLAEHRHNRSVHGGVFYCHGSDGEYCGMFDDQRAWREHVAPLIAVHLQNAMSAHQCEMPDAAPDQKWRCWCGLAWRAVDAGPLDIRWEPYGRGQLTAMETGHDMGASFASEMFPQHTRPQK